MGDRAVRRPDSRASLAKRWDVVVDNLHENPKRLAVVAFTSPGYWYGSALAVQKGNPKNIHTSADMAGQAVGTVRGSFNQGLLEKRTDLKELKLYTSNEAEFADLIAGPRRRDHGGRHQDRAVHEEPPRARQWNSPRDIRWPPKNTAMRATRSRKEDVDLNHAVSRALDEIRGDGTPAQDHRGVRPYRPEPLVLPGQVSLAILSLA